MREISCTTQGVSLVLVHYKRFIHASRISYKQSTAQSVLKKYNGPKHTTLPSSNDKQKVFFNDKSNGFQKFLPKLFKRWGFTLIIFETDQTLQPSLTRLQAHIKTSSHLHLLLLQVSVDVRAISMHRPRPTHTHTQITE